MKIPISWLNEYVDVSDLTPRELSDKLTFSGVEVEGIETSGPALDDHFVVGEVLTCEPHPDSDHMHVCTVSTGDVTLGIVCGAPNCRAGLKVAVAKIGATIPDGGFKIKASKLRGVMSNGMLCSGRELCLSDDHTGILELDPAAVPGTPLADVLPKGETVFDLEITWNRSDCLSVIGIAREFAALLGRPLRTPDVSFDETGPDVNTLAKVVVETRDCPRYTARVLTGVKDGPSPDWMAKRLELCGVRSLGLIVDVTNYVMLECGQPLHAFDHTRLADSTIIVRQARPGEKIKTLDGVERALDPSMCVIADANAPVAVGGVMGGAESEIESATDTVLVESALFAAPSIKRTATALGLHSEASHRYERSVDPGVADWASRRAVSLLAKYGGGTVAKGVIDIDNRPAPAAPVRLSFDRARKLIGIDLADDAMVAILSSLGLEVAGRDASGASFRIPSWRVDLLEEADLVEEISRMHGLDKLPDVAPAAIAVQGADDAPFRAEAACREAAAAMGLAEGMHYSFLSAAELDAFEPDGPEGAPRRRLALPNPVSGDFAILRNSLLPQLVQSLGRNAARQIEAPALFEIGRVFWRGADGAPAEEKRVSLGFCGPFGRDALHRRAPVDDEEAMLWLKGLVERLATALHAAPPRFEAADCPAFSRGWSLAIRVGRDVAGRMGLVSKALRHSWRVNSPMAVAELSLAPLLANYGSHRALKPVTPFPAVMRDVAVVAQASLPSGEIVRAINKSAPKILTGVSLFDIFKPKSADGAKRSLAYALEFRSPERTLTDDEVNAAFARILAALKALPGVEVRE
ncbi:MAG: phenylalanine--tRNA ligase subunit beta [Kiritimatiellae bacterium]|nr:phenylalanine--tRNA ligase subunit beta [Kiritimatiellia bacterium]